MSETSGYRLETVTEAPISDTDATKYGYLLTVLDRPAQPYDANFAHTGIERVIGSGGSEMLAIRDTNNEVVTTATLNFLPTLSGDRQAWVDDVVTDPDHQGRGLMTTVMDELQTRATQQQATEIYLTSKTERGPARNGYEKRGYVLGGHTTKLVVFRKCLSDADAAMPVAENVSVLEGGYSADDIQQLSGLLNADAETVEQNVQTITAETEPFNRIFVVRKMGVIAAAAVVSLCPIPLGYKPWITEMTGEGEDLQAVIAASEQWVAENGGAFLNIIDEDDAIETIGQRGYVKRDSGVFIKPL